MGVGDVLTEGCCVAAGALFATAGADTEGVATVGAAGSASGAVGEGKARATHVLSRSAIFEEVWGYDFPTSGNALEVYIGYLRRKTEADGEPLVGRQPRARRRWGDRGGGHWVRILPVSRSARNTTPPRTPETVPTGIS